MGAVLPNRLWRWWSLCQACGRVALGWVSAGAQHSAQGQPKAEAASSCWRQLSWRGSAARAVGATHATTLAWSCSVAMSMAFWPSALRTRMSIPKSSTSICTNSRRPRLHASMSGVFPEASLACSCAPPMPPNTLSSMPRSPLEHAARKHERPSRSQLSVDAPSSFRRSAMVVCPPSPGGEGPYPHAVEQHRTTNRPSARGVPCQSACATCPLLGPEDLALRHP